MKKAFINQIKVKKSSILTIIATMIITYIFGMILTTVSIKIDDIGDVLVSPGSLMALMSGLFVVVLSIIASYIRGFQTSIAMGRTRKSYITAQYILECIIILATILLSIILCFIEQSLTKVMYAGYEYINIFEYFSGPFYIGMAAIIIVVLPIIGMFIGGLYLRFGKTAFWITWGVYMIFTMSSGRFNIINLITTNTITKVIAIIASIIIVIGMSFTTIVLSQKQEVKNY